MTEQQYDNLFNEGAEGFNPYRTPKNDGGEPMWSKIEGRMSKVQRLLNGIGNDAFDASRKARLEAEFAELKIAYEAAEKD